MANEIARDCESFNMYVAVIHFKRIWDIVKDVLLTIMIDRIYEADNRMQCIVTTAN